MVTPSAVDAFAINLDRLVTLAERLRSSLAPQSSNKIELRALTGPVHCTRNVFFSLTFSDGVHWRIRVPHTSDYEPFTEAAGRALTSEVKTLQLLGRETTIPVPTIFDYCASPLNDLGVPYVITSEMEGVPASDVWWPAEHVDSATLEERRRRILQTVAAAMVQLRPFVYDAVGMLRFGADGQVCEIGKCRVRDYAEDLHTALMRSSDDDCGGETFLELGPFRTSRRYLHEAHALQSVQPADLAAGCHRFLELIIRCTPPSLGPSSTSSTIIPQSSSPTGNLGCSWLQRLRPAARTIGRLFAFALESRRGAVHVPPAPRSRDPAESFVLGHPDFDLRHFLVSPTDGTLLGIVGWEGVQTAPRGLGWARYPGWITRDWDPAMYSGAPYVEASGRSMLEHSEIELKAYRGMYLQAMRVLLAGQNRQAQDEEEEGEVELDKAHWTRKSVFLEAVEIACQNPLCACPIVDKIFAVAFPDGVEDGAGASRSSSNHSGGGNGGHSGTRSGSGCGSGNWLRNDSRDTIAWGGGGGGGGGGNGTAVEEVRRLTAREVFQRLKEGRLDPRTEERIRVRVKRLFL